MGGPKSGQAILEYLIILTIAIALAGILQFGLRKSMGRLWLGVSCDVAAPCPTCRDSTASLRAAEGPLGAPGACQVNQ